MTLVTNRRGIVACVTLLLLSTTIVATAADSLSTAAEPYPTPATEWALSAEGISQITPASGAGLLSAPLRVVMTDGFTGRDVSGSASRSAFTSGRSAEFAEALDLPGVRATQRLTATGGTLSWRVEIANGGGEEARLSVALVAPVALDGAVSYFDGYDLHEPLSGTAGRDVIEQTFPMSAVYSADAGLAVGVRPDSLISWLESGVDEQQRFSYGTRFSLLPGETAAVEFVLFTFTPVSGHLDAIQGFQQRFPEAYEIADDVDPRITSFGTDTLGYGRNAQREEVDDVEQAANIRSGYGSWDWAYACFRRCGDWLGRPELWNWEMDEAERARVQDRSETFWFDLMDQQRFRETRQAGWRSIDEGFNVAAAFYLINWVEEHLVGTLGAEEYVYDYGDKGPRLSWVTGTSFELHMFPWGTPFEETIRRDFPVLVEELGLHGFALDIASDPARYRGPTDHLLPGWAWDEEGRYVHTGVGQRLMLDYLRSLRQDGFRMGIVTNGGDPFMVTADADATINEAKDQPNLRWQDARPLRWRFGSKRIHLHAGGGFDNPALNVDWQSLSPEQIRLFYQDHLNEWLLGCWQGGYVPGVMHVFGRESITRAMPALIDVQGRGYRAVPACTGDERLARARYGSGLQSVLAISNPTTETVASDEQIASTYLADGAVLPVHYEGEDLQFTVDGERTRLPIELTRHQTTLIALPVALEAADGEALALTGSSSASVRADRITWRLSLDAPAQRTVRLRAEAPPLFALESVRLNRESVDLAEPITLSPGENELVLTCLSQLFRSPESALLEFPFAQSKIVLPERPDPRESGAAQMLQDFIVFHEQVTPPVAPAATGPAIVIETGNEPGVTVSDGTLRISGETPFDTQQLAARVIRLVMAEKYEYVHPFGITVPVQPTRDMLAKIGVGRTDYFAQVEVGDREVPSPLAGTQIANISTIRAAVARPEHGSPLQAGFYADDRVYAWAIKSPMMLDHRSVAVYMNADSAETGRMGVADGTDWVLSVRRGEEGARLTRYRDIPRDADGRTITENASTRQVAQYEGGAMRAGDVLYVIVDRSLLDAMPPARDHRFYVLAYDAEDTMARGTWRADPRATGVLTPILDQTPPAEPGDAARRLPTLDAPTLQAEIALDGRLDEPQWAQAAFIDHFIPLRGAVLQEPTEAWAFFTDDALMLGFRCWEGQAGYMHAGAYERDADRIWMNADHVEIFLAPGVAPDATEYSFYQLMVSPSGSQWDGYNLEVDWNGDWEAAADAGEGYWSAEVRIPLSMMDGAADAETWRLNVARFRSLGREWATWAPVVQGLQKPSGFGVLRRE